MIVVLDNHDSYTFNLFQLLQEQTARPVRVVSSTAAEEAVALLRGGGVVGLVVSPGPGHPAVADDFAGSALAIDAALALGVPVLGVCLGHQGIALRFGCVVDRAPRARHGWVSPLEHSGTGLFAGLPQGTRVTRYHSLAIVEPIAEDAGIEVTARSEDGVVQAFDVFATGPAGSVPSTSSAPRGHADGEPAAGAGSDSGRSGRSGEADAGAGAAVGERRVVARGVQFHPESIATEHGRELLANALAWFEDAAAGRASSAEAPTVGAAESNETAGELGGALGATASGGRSADAAEIASTASIGDSASAEPGPEGVAAVAGTEPCEADGSGDREATARRGAAAGSGAAVGVDAESAGRAAGRIGTTDARDGASEASAPVRAADADLVAPAGAAVGPAMRRGTMTRILSASVTTLAGAGVDGSRDEVSEPTTGLVAAPSTDAAAVAIYARAIARRRGSFWIDRAEGDDRAPRWSIIGDAVPLPGADSAEPFGAVPKREAGSGSAASAAGGPGSPLAHPDRPYGPVVVRARRGAATVDGWPDATGPVRRAELRARRSGDSASSGSEAPDSFDVLDALVGGGDVRVVGGEALPFRGGVVGFQGYDEGVRLLGQGNRDATTPDAVWIVPHRWIVVDHATGGVTACARVDSSAEGDGEGAERDRERGARGRSAVAEGLGAASAADADALALAQARLDAWAAEIRRILNEPVGPVGAGGGAETRTEAARARAAGSRPAASTEPNSPFGTVPNGEFGSIGGDATAASPADRLAPGAWALSREEYRDRIRESVEEMLAGETYEVCLTNEFRVDASVDPDPLELFAHLRENDAVPYAALLELDDDGERLDVVSASPERFLRGTADGAFETKPIKGTAPRTGNPVEDERAIAHLLGDAKTFAEHLMIVDLLRNDLGRVSEPGTVEVPSLMHIESFETVHQLVSTVRGWAPGVPTAEVVRALFPGGSMTGAPKERTLSIIDRLEGRPRGVYSGALGAVGLDGSCDLSIVIRTAVRDARGWTIGAGGAIVLDSDPDAEIAEVELKASSLRRALAAVSAGAAGPAAPAPAQMP